MCFEMCDKDPKKCKSKDGIRFFQLNSSLRKIILEDLEALSCGLQMLESLNQNGGLIDRNTMPPKVQSALSRIVETPISLKGYVYSGRDLCVIKYAVSKMTPETF